MTEQVPPTGLDDPETVETERGDPPAEGDIGGPTTTGVPAVDEVLADVDRLDDQPLEEHLATFERAHDSLRAALDAPAADEADRAHGQGHRPGDPA
jgi:hypothetical protein